jgi:branched-chain amino acid transport system substrate-binding protein
MKRTPKARITAVAAAALMGIAGLAACSSGSTGSGSSDTGSSDPGSSSAPAESGSDSSSAGSGDSSGGTIKIGFFSPQSGFAASDGKSALDAANLAVKHLNADGGLNGATIELVPYDDGSDAKQAVSIATKLTTQDNVAAVVSGSYSDQTLAAASIFQRAGIPMTAAYAVNPGIPATGDGMFQIATSGTVEGRAGAVALVDKLGVKKVAIIAIDNDFGNALIDGFKQEADKLGATIVSTDKNQFGEKDFGPVIDKGIAAGAEGFYIPQYSAEAQQFLTAYRQRNLTQPIVGTEGIDSTLQFIEPNAKLADGMVFTTVLNRDSTDPATQKFLKDFTDAYGHAPDMVAATTYDAVMVLKAAADNEKSTDAAALKKGITDLTKYPGAAGTIEKFIDRVSIHPVELEVFKDGGVHHYATVDDPAIITP